MDPKGKKCWCMIIRFCKKKTKSLIWHRTPNDKKDLFPTIEAKKNIFLWSKLVSQAYFCSDWEYIWSKTVVLRDWYFDFETSRFQDFAIFLGFRRIWSRKKYQFRIQKIASWRLYEIRQSPTCLCTTFNFLTKTTIATFPAGHLGRHLTTTSGEKYHKRVRQDKENRTYRTDRTLRKKMIDVSTWLLAKSEI